MNQEELENETDVKPLDKTETNKTSASIEKDARNPISKKTPIIDHHKLINNTISNFFDENHLFDLLNKQILFKNKKNKTKTNKIGNGDGCGSSNGGNTVSNIETSIAAVKQANEPTAATTKNKTVSNVVKESETNKSGSISSTSSSSSSTTSTNSKSALTGLDKKLLKKKIMSNIGKIKIEDYVSAFFQLGLCSAFFQLELCSAFFQYLN